MSAISPLRPADDEQLLTGWGRTAPSRAHVRTVASVADVQQAIAQAGPRGVLARGLGRSYGDAAQSGGATVLDLSAMSQISLDEVAGTVTAGSGASLDAILRAIVPQGWFVPVSPGHLRLACAGDDPRRRHRRASRPHPGG